MKKRTQYLILFILTFVLYGNTLLNDYALDDAIVITENEYTLNGIHGIGDLFSTGSFSGFFDQKDKKLVAGGRYRPLSMATFAIEWQIIMGTPFDGVNQKTLEKRMNYNASPKYILPSQKLLKDLSKTIHLEDRKQRIQQQNAILNNVKILTDKEKRIIRKNLEKMHSKRKTALFVSHFLNVLFFALTILVLFLLLENLFSNFKADKWYLSVPFIASLLFLAHPIHTEVVANIKGRDEILSLLGALIAALFVVKYIKKQKWYFILISFIAFLAALFSKEVAVTFLAIIPLAVFFFIAEENKFKNTIITMVPLVIASVIYFYVRNRVVGGMSFEPSQELMNNSFLGMTFPEKFATIFYTLLLYIKLLIFPHPLTYDYYPYHIPIMHWTNIWPIISLIVYLAIGIYALAGLRKKRIVSFGILFYLFALSPMSNIFFPIGVFMNERFIYAASIGFVIILAYLISNKLPLWIKNKNTLMVILGVILTLYSVKTISRNRVWKNDFTLFTTDVKTSKNSAKSNTSAGGKLIEEAIKSGNRNVRLEYLNKAIFYLKRAIKIHPKYNDALLLMGNAQWERYHNLDSVFKYYNHILRQNPRYGQVYTNIFESKMNIVFNESEKADQNIKVLRALEKYSPNNFDVNYYLGRIYGRYINNLSLSIRYLEKAAKINPNKVEVFKDLGVAYGIIHDYKKSAIALSKAVELDPKDPIMKINLAMTYANLKKYQDALRIMDSTFAMNFDSNNANVLINLGYLYQRMQQKEKAKQCFAKAKVLNPKLFKK